MSPDKRKPGADFSRREFLGSLAAAAAYVVAPEAARALAPHSTNEQPPQTPEVSEQARERTEHFKPLGGPIEWQYVQFQYVNEKGERIGVTVSLSELASEAFKTGQLLVMSHNLATGETKEQIHSGTRVFDAQNSKYVFKGTKGEMLAELSYSAAADAYTLKVDTDEFRSAALDQGGLVLKPQGDLVKVSKDGEFTVAKDGNTEVTTKYCADHIQVQGHDGSVFGYGRRDSENLENKGPLKMMDVDHTWFHTSGDLDNGTQFYATVWNCTTGGNFRFFDIVVVDQKTGEVKKQFQLNEDDPEFRVEFIPIESEMERLTPPNGQKEKMAHGGIVRVRNGDEVLLELAIDGDPGQVIDRMLLRMVEAHGQYTGGQVLGRNVQTCHNAIYETTVER